tara:strand:- start:1162 stop:1797 length:636 start_codon:yes stop_codon:yes gene_type:complete
LVPPLGTSGSGSYYQELRRRSPPTVTQEALSESFMRHVISALVQNVPGVLAHVAGMFASRGYNIDSLAVGETESPHLSRMTFVVVGDDGTLSQVRKQLEKIVTVVRVDDISAQDFVERDLMLLKVRATAGEQRSEIRELTDIFRGRIVDVSQDALMIEISGKECKIEAYIDLIRPFGITELVRTGRIALVRGQRQVKPEVSGSENRAVDAG